MRLNAPKLQHAPFRCHGVSDMLLSTPRHQGHGQRHLKQQVRRSLSRPIHSSSVSGSNSSTSSMVALCALPRIADFIRDECPIRGVDGSFREQPARPGSELQDMCVIQMHEESLLVPGERQLMYVQEAQLERIIDDQGTAVLACLQHPSSGDGFAPKLLSPARGSWAASARVGGVQRLPGSSRALIRLMVTDRVAVQALSSPGPDLVLARAAQLRDRWCYFVRTAALVQHLGSSDGVPGSSNGGPAAGGDVLNAVRQVQDAATELLQLLQQLCSSIQHLTDAADGSGKSSALQQQLLQYEAAEELSELVAWCEMQELSGGSSSSSGLYGSDGLLPADGLLMERAWRLSFAPFACKGLATALGVDVETGKSSSVSSSSCEVLEMMDLGLRLEAAWELGQALRQKLSARTSLEQLQA